MTDRTPRALAAAYFDAWQARDADALRDVLADDVTFVGPLGTADGVEACVAGLIGMAAIITGLEVRARVADDSDVITFFDLHTADAPPAPTANWSHVVDGRIQQVRVAFDPRGILGSG